LTEYPREWQRESTSLEIGRISERDSKGVGVELAFRIWKDNTEKLKNKKIKNWGGKPLKKIKLNGKIIIIFFFEKHGGLGGLGEAKEFSLLIKRERER